MFSITSSNHQLQHPHHDHQKQQQQQQPRFAMDLSLFRYAKQLRLLGCDVLCSGDVKLQSLVEAAEQEKRIIIASIGKSIPLLCKYTLLGDLTFGKAFENLKTVRTINNGKCRTQVMTKKRGKGKHCNNEDDDDEEESGDDSEDEKEQRQKERASKKQKSKNGDDNDSSTSCSDDEQKDTDYFGAAAILGEEPVKDPRKFHWVEEQDPETSKMMKRRRRLVGYNSDGDSDWEYEEAKKTEAKLEQQLQLEQDKEAKKVSKKIKNGRTSNNQQPHQSSASASTNEALQARLYNRLTNLVKSATPGSTAALAANACNFALLRAQRETQSPHVEYIVVDIHFNFKQMLAAIILIAGVRWMPSVLFTRCVKCNSKIVAVTKASVSGVVTDAIYRLYEHFYQCPSCENVFWGVDNGLVVNFKSARTTEYLRSLFEEDFSPSSNSRQFSGDSNDDDQQNNSENENDDQNKFDSLGRRIVPPRTSRAALRWGVMPRHIFSFPRKIKVIIFDFMTHEEMDNLVLACPMFRELVDRKKRGVDMKFIPEMKMKRKKAAEIAAAAAAAGKTTSLA